jgi:hypothetical protein
VVEAHSRTSAFHPGLPSTKPHAVDSFAPISLKKSVGGMRLALAGNNDSQATPVMNQNFSQEFLEDQ